MNIILWVLQILLAFIFITQGIGHFNVQPGLGEMFSWMYDLPSGLHYFSGTVEILAGLGLILPGITKIQTRLIPLAAAGLVLVMLGASAWHFPRDEFQMIGLNTFLAILAGIVAYGRWKLRPLVDRGGATD